jgi:gamma-glutamylputrescine oxidase
LLILRTSCKIIDVRYGKMSGKREAGMAANIGPGEHTQIGERVDTCEVVVVGAGLVGAAVVANLVAEGLDVAVLEAREIASGATAHTAGLILTGMPLPYAQAVEQYGQEMGQALWRLTLDSRASLISVAEQMGVAVDRSGSLTLATNDEEASVLRTSAEMLTAEGFQVRYDETDPLGRGFVAALHHPDDVVVDTVALTEGLLRAQNVPVHIHTEVYGLEQDGDDVRVLARGRTVRASTVVLAANAYAPLIDSYFADKVAPVRGHILATQPLDEGLIPIPGSAGPFYFRQLPDRRFLFAAWPREYETPAAGPDEQSIEIDLMRFVGRHFSEATNRFARRESSVMGVSRDGLPLIGALPHLPQVFFAVGFGGAGLNLAFAAADMLTGLIDRGAEPGLLSAKRLE